VNLWKKENYRGSAAAEVSVFACSANSGRFRSSQHSARSTQHSQHAPLTTRSLLLLFPLYTPLTHPTGNCCLCSFPLTESSFNSNRPLTACFWYESIVRDCLHRVSLFPLSLRTNQPLTAANTRTPIQYSLDSMYRFIFQPQIFPAVKAESRTR
jgi:hypothetical protein